MRCFVLTDPTMARRGRNMVAAMIAASPIPVQSGNVYRVGFDLLMAYGIGHQLRRQYWLQHLRAGGHCIGWDLGYWHRDRKTMRLTIDADHPQALIRLGEDPARFAASGIELRNDFNPAGHVVIVGMSAKADRMMNMTHNQWEMRAAMLARHGYPGHLVVFHPKRPTDPVLPGFQTMRGPIEEVLKGASLVVCRHSNVAIDACIAGIPVHCEDGAAFALYRHNTSPTPALRLAFLQGLAHWQYVPEEAATAWQFILGRLGST